MSVSQAIVEFLAHQYTVDGDIRVRTIEGFYGIFGHGNVAGIGQSLKQLSVTDPMLMPYHQARNEQAMGHESIAFSRMTRRRSTYACAASVGPGAANMLTDDRPPVVSHRDAYKEVEANMERLRAQYAHIPQAPFTILNTPLVHGIEISGAYRQDDATQRFIKNSIQSSGVNAEGVSRAINQSYTFYADIFETDPNTGVSFTGTAANALKIGPKVDV